MTVKNETLSLFNEPTVFTASFEGESINDICARLGIVTVKEGKDSFWILPDGSKVARPMVNRFEEKILEYMNVKIVYK